MPSTESKLPVGQTLVGKYRVVREIGRGGMAAVYEAEQLSLGKKVAVKVLASELAASTIVIERFFREARAAASVKSPYIVDVYDSGRLDDGRPFIAMELLEGESLYDRMARVRIIDVETTIRVIVHTAKGLMKAHAAGIVHRDLKPENIFLTKGEDGEDTCKILDFGLAKFYAPVDEDKAQKRLTREGAVFGTPAYMSPEQVKGQGTVDHRADLWALGCMAFECLIGRPVWNMDQGVAMTFASIATGPIPVPSDIRGDLPPAFDAWFKKCLERDPNHRYQSAKELADAFVEAWGQERPKASSASYPNVGMPASSPFSRPFGGGQGDVSSDATVETARAMSPGVMTARGPVGAINGARASIGSQGSSPFPLVTRASADVPPTSQPDAPLPKKVSTLRLVLSAVLFAASIFAALFVWLRFLNPQVFTPVVQSTATAPPSAVPSAAGAPSPEGEPKWVPVIAEGQRRFTQSDVKGALDKFQEATTLGPAAAIVAKVFSEQVKIASNPKEVSGACKPVSFSRPRVSFDRKAERPAILTTTKGYLVTWTDDHEQKDKDHVYGALLDPTGRSVGPVRDLTPEAGDAQRPQLVPQSADRSVLLWWDGRGREAGVRVRLIDADGRIDPSHGNSVLVGAARPGDYWPTIEKGPNGFFVVWQDDRDKEKDNDLFVRRLTPDLDTVGPETRLTDYHVPQKSKNPVPRVRYPSAVVAANTLLVAYRLEREKDHTIWRLKVPLDDLDRGLSESKDPNRDSRVLGDSVRMSDEKLLSDAPAIACGKEGCFVVWHGDPSGVWVAGIDPNGGRVQWHKKIAEKGGHPSVAANGNQVAVAYYEGNRLRMAFLSRDGVTSPSTLFRINDDKLPRPSIAPGVDANEWVIAWQDMDVPKGMSEVYASRVVCR